MLKELQSVKEQLFDAPIEVKESFNNLVKYFADEKFYVVHEFSPMGPGTLMVKTDSQIKAREEKYKDNKYPFSKAAGSSSGWKVKAGPFKTKEEAKAKRDEMKKNQMKR